MEIRTNVVRLSGVRLANKNQQDFRYFANENALSANERKKRAKFLLMDKAVVTLLIRSFFNNGELFANCTYTISCYIIAVQEVVALKEQKYHLYLSKDEYSEVLQSLIRLKNSLIAQGRYTDAVDDILCKVLSAKKRKLKIKYI